LTASAMVAPQNTQPISVNYSGDSNYESAFTATPFVTVNQPDFSIGTNPPSVTITAGQTGTTQVTVTPVNSISDSVGLSCVPFQLANVTCSFNPPPPLRVTGGNATTTTLSVATLPPSPSSTTTLVLNRRLPWNKIWPIGNWMFALADGLAILFLTLSASRKKRRVAATLGMAGLLFLVLSCGSSSAGGGGGGGGGGGPAPTSITLTTSSVKVQLGATFTLTATVHSTHPVTGSVYFLNSGGGILSSGPVINGGTTVPVTVQTAGTLILAAQYSGDSNNQASQTTGSIDEVITGTGQLLMYGTGLGNSHSDTINVTIQ
jgi:hypothetical protein